MGEKGDRGLPGNQGVQGPKGDGVCIHLCYYKQFILYSILALDFWSVLEFFIEFY